MGRKRLKVWTRGAAAAAIALASMAGASAAQVERVVQTGEIVALRMNTALSSKTSRAGDKFTAAVSRDLRIDGVNVVPIGTVVEGHVTSVEPAKRLSRSGTIAVEFDRLVFKDGRSVPIVGQLTSLDPDQRHQIDQDEGAVQGESTTKRNVIFIGGGAGAGAIIGAVAGSGGTGAGIGAGLGTAAVLLSKGNEATIDPGYEFGLEVLRAIRIPAPGPGGAAGAATREDLLYAQGYLRDRGYYAGQVDGRLTSTTKAALLRFQRAEQLAESGQLDVQTARAMGLVDEEATRSVPLKVVSFDARPTADGGADVTIAATANTGGWTVFENHFVTQDALHVYVRGVAPDGPATDALARHEVRFTLAPEDARTAVRYVVHGSGPDLTGELGAETGPDLHALSQRVNLMLTGYEKALGVRPTRTGSVTLAGRGYTDAEIELYFAVNSLASSLQLYSAFDASLRDQNAMKGAAQVIVRTARQVDRAIGRAGTQRTTGAERDWSALRQDFADLAQTIGASLDREER